jgi:hypothetical protein
VQRVRTCKEKQGRWIFILFCSLFLFFDMAFDDGICQDVYASRLHVESCFASLPPDVIAPLLQDDSQRTPQGDLAKDLEEEAIQENLLYQAELEHLPGETPEEQELQQEQEDRADNDNAEENKADEHGRRPGQLKQQQPEAQPDYQQ